MKKTQSFKVSEAILLGTEKAIIMQILNDNPMNPIGVGISLLDFKNEMPYLAEKKILKHLEQLEQKKLITYNNNQRNYKINFDLRGK